MVEPEETKLADFDDVTVSLGRLQPFGPRRTAELVDVGAGRLPRRTSRASTSPGKVVLTTAAPGARRKDRRLGTGGRGRHILREHSPGLPFRHARPDRLPQGPRLSPPGKPGPWAFMISARQYGRLQDLLRKAKAAKGSPRQGPGGDRIRRSGNPASRPIFGRRSGGPRSTTRTSC